MTAARGPAPTARSRNPQSVRAKTIPEHHGGQQCDDESGVQPGPRQHGQPGRNGDRVALGIDVLRFLQRALDHQAHERARHEIEEERADDLEHPIAKLQPDRHDHPCRAGEHGGGEHRRYGDGCGSPHDVQPDPGSRDRAGIELPLRADVQRAATKGQRDPQPDDDERSRTDEGRRAERVPGAERSPPQRAQRRDRIVAGQLQTGRKDHHAQEQRQQGSSSAHRSP